MLAQEPAEEFSTQLGLLFTASGIGYKQLINAAIRHPVPIKLKTSTLSGWVTGKSIPSDSQKLKFVVEYLELNVKPGGTYQRRGIAAWAAMRQRAWDQKHVNPGGRPQGPRRGSLERDLRPIPSQPPRIDVRLTAAPIEAVLDPHAHYTPWAEDRRADLMQDCDSAPRFAPNDVANLFRMINVMPRDPWTVPDGRTVAEYTAEVDDYLSRVVSVHTAGARHGQAQHRPAMLAITLVNNTELNLNDVQLDISIPGVSTYADQPTKSTGRTSVAMQKPPKRYGTPTRLPGPNYFATQAAVAGLYRDSNNILPAGLIGLGRPPRNPWTARQDDTGIVIQYTGPNARPGETIKLEPMPIRVPPGVTQITAIWTATATNVNGRQAGEFTINVNDSTYEMPPAPDEDEDIPAR